MPSSIKRVVFLGRHARMNWLQVELDLPPMSVLQRNVTIVSEDHHIDRMRGFNPETLRYIAADPTPYMIEFVRSRGHQSITFEETKQWLKSLLPTV
jgi:hypothetical protein